MKVLVIFLLSTVWELRGIQSQATADDEDVYRNYVTRYWSAVDQTSERPELGLDRAWLTINSSVDYDVQVWAQSDECYKCPMMFIKTAPQSNMSWLTVNTSFPTTLSLGRKETGGVLRNICKFHLTFKEKGDYWIFIKHSQTSGCTFLLANEPEDPEMAILYLFIGLLGLAVLYVCGKALYRYVRQRSTRSSDDVDIGRDNPGIDVLDMNDILGNKTSEEHTNNPAISEEAPKTKRRLKSLDTFRGFTLMIMIFVNYGGGGYWFFEHAPWNGIFVADLVFPWFVFIMGVSMNFSFKSMYKKNWTNQRIAYRIVWRAVKIFALGFTLGTHHYVADMPRVRVMGVLQRLALTYLMTSLIHLAFSRKQDSHQDKKWASIRDLVLYLPEWAANLCLLGIHLGIVYALPVPGCPTGYVGPGGLGDDVTAVNCTGGATQYVDKRILGEDHMYQYPTAQILYQTRVPFDPEGMLGTLSCVFLCFLGVQCGRIVLLYQEHKQRLIRFCIWAVVLGAFGALLTKCSKNDGWIPPNKNIWSLSYSLITASFAYILLSLLYLVIDVLGKWDGQPFIYMGMNSIVIYFCHAAFYKQFPVTWEVAEGHWRALLMAAWGAAVWLGVAFYLKVKGIFIAL